MKAGTPIRTAASLLTLAIGTLAFAAPRAGMAAGHADGALLPHSSAANAPQADAQALERAKAKFAYALSIVDQHKGQAKAAGIAGDNWRFEMVGNLMKGSEADFPSVSLARSFADAMSASLSVARSGNGVKPSSSSNEAVPAIVGTTGGGLGSPTTDLVYVPITPCRVLDTRAAGGGVLAAGAVNTYFFSGSNVGAASCSVAGQIPSSSAAAAFAANVTIDDSSLGGFTPGAYLQIFPQGTSTPTSFMNFGPGQIIANAGIVSLNQTNGQFSIVTSAPANVIVDTYGVFIAPQPTALDCVTVNNNSSFLGVVNATCPATYTLTGGGCQSNSINDHTYQTLPNSSTTWGCGFWPETGGTIGTTLTAYARCCRVPGRIAPF